MRWNLWLDIITVARGWLIKVLLPLVVHQFQVAAFVRVLQPLVEEQIFARFLPDKLTFASLNRLDFEARSRVSPLLLYGLEALATDLHHTMVCHDILADFGLRLRPRILNVDIVKMWTRRLKMFY